MPHLRSFLLRDPEFIQKLLARVMPGLQRLFGCDVRGMEALGEGPYLFVSNHNIGAPIETFALLNEWERLYHGKKPIYALAHRIAFASPLFRSQFERLGAVPATHEMACEVFASGASLIVFPGGNAEAVRPITQQDRCELGGHKGWAKIALNNSVAIVPVSIVGSHAVNPIFFQSQWLAKFLVIPKLMGLRWFPVSLSQIVYSYIAFSLSSFMCPLWMSAGLTWIVFSSTPLMPILPSKIKIKIDTPLPTLTLTQDLADEAQKVDFLYHHTANLIQSGMDELKTGQ